MPGRAGGSAVRGSRVEAGLSSPAPGCTDVVRSSPLLFNGQWGQTAPMGWFLARALGEEYVPMTVSFGRGVVSVTSLRGVG
jgi:hypothetical protein